MCVEIYAKKREAHSVCNEFQCAANQVEDSTYRTRHRTPDCQCEHWGPDVKKLTAKIRMSQIPQILMRQTKNPDGSKSLQCDLGSAQLGASPSAMTSHVWSDGAHNPCYPRPQNLTFFIQVSETRKITRYLPVNWNFFTKSVGEGREV